MTDSEVFEPIIPVVGVRILARHVVELTFGNHEARVIDLEPMLWGPMYQLLLTDYSEFQKISVDAEAATIVWPNRMPH